MNPKTLAWHTSCRQFFLATLACATNGTKRLVKSVSETVPKLLFWPPPVYQDLSVRQDWPVKNVIKDLKQQQQERERDESYRFNNQNNNFARASHFFVHFFALTAWLRHENT